MSISQNAVEAPGSGHPVSRSDQPRKPGRLRAVLLIGLIAIGAALALRMSPWAREYQLNRASLEVLKTWAAESPRDPLVFYYLGTQYNNAGILPEALSSF